MNEEFKPVAILIAIIFVGFIILTAVNSNDSKSNNPPENSASSVGQSEKNSNDNKSGYENDLINKIRPSLIRVNCKGSLGQVSESGILMNNGSGYLKNVNAGLIVTATDIMMAGHPDEINCSIIYDQKTHRASIGSFSYKQQPNIDLMYLFTDKKLVNYKSFLGEVMEPCENNTQSVVGNNVLILGYTDDGVDISLENGKISDVQKNNYGTIYYLSPNVDKIFNGSLVTDLTQKCSLGIFTWDTINNFNGKGLVQDWHMIEGGTDNPWVLPKQ